jgi:ubiquitin-protein ligase
MFHPNSKYCDYAVYSNGEVCISILHPPFEDPTNPQERLDEKWNPVLTMEAVLMSVNSMLIDPNLESPANVDAAKMYKEKRQ